MKEKNENHGITTENNLKFIFEKIFGKDLVFDSPELHEEGGKKLELTDMLVFASETIITLQSKSIDINTDDLNEITYYRINKKFEKARTQINRTLNAMKRKDKVFLKFSQGKFVLPWNFFNKTLGIITLNIPDSEYSNPEFRFQFKKFENYKGIDLHVFIYQDLLHMTNELKTGGDFLDYLEARKLLEESSELSAITNELDILATYKSNYKWIEDFKNKKYDHLIITPGEWEYYLKTKNKEIHIRDSFLNKVTLIDVLINFLKESVQYGVEHLGVLEEKSILDYFKTLCVVGGLPEIHKHIYEEKIQEKIKLSKNCEQRYFLTKFKNYWLLFLFSNETETDREKRRKKLHFFSCQTAKHIIEERTAPEYTEPEMIVAIATEGAKAPGRSFDMEIFKVNDSHKIFEDFSNIKKIEMFNPKSIYGQIDEWSISKNTE